MCHHRTNSAVGDLGELGTEEPLASANEEVDADENSENEKPWSDADDSSSSKEDNMESDPEVLRKFGGSSMVVDSDSESENQLEDDEKATYCRPLYIPPFPLPLAESCASTPEPSTETEWPAASPPEASASRFVHEELANLAPVIQPKENEPEENDSNRRSSGRMRRKIQVDNRCKCDTEITAEEKEVGDSVMMCKARVVVKQFGCM